MNRPQYTLPQVIGMMLLASLATVTAISQYPRMVPQPRLLWSIESNCPATDNAADRAGMHVANGIIRGSKKAKRGQPVQLTAELREADSLIPERR